MIRVVLDTNIVVSANLRAGGLPEAVFNLAINGAIQLCISEPVLAEYEEVLSRARLAIPREKVATALARIREKGSLVTVTVSVDAAACPDDGDDIIFWNALKRPAPIILSLATANTIPANGRKPGS